MPPTSSRTKVAEVMPERMADKANGVAIQSHRFDDDALRSIQSFDDVAALLSESGIAVANAAEEMGNGFTILQDKGILCGVPLMLLAWQFNPGDNGDFVSINAVAKMPGTGTPGKFVINDGGSGICRQLMDYTNKTGKTAGLMVSRGLRRSDYQYIDENGKPKNATTFYLDTSAA